MATKKQTPEQKLRDKVKSNIDTRKTFLEQNEHRSVLNAFTEKFILCEIATKIILSEYFKNNGEEKDYRDLKLHTTTIKNALLAASYDINDEILKGMFRSKQPRNQRSARDLRNGILHDYNIQDIKEVIERKDEISELMDKYLQFTYTE